MNTDQVFDVIEQIAATKKRTDHLAILQVHAHSDTLRRVLLAANDPFSNYGFGSPPELPPSGTGMFLYEQLMLLEDLKTGQLTGGAAEVAVERHMRMLTPKSQALLARILTKDLRCGVGTTTINKVFPNLIPVFPYMRCSLPKEAKVHNFQWQEGVFSQEKADGMFCNLEVGYNRESVRMTSRQGSPFPMAQFKELAVEALTTLARGTQTHGELLVKVDGKVAERQISNGILNRILEGGEFLDNEEPIFLAWDQIPLEEVKSKNKYAVFYKYRFQELAKQIVGTTGKIDLIPTRIVHSLQEAQEHFREILAQGKEGTVFKCPTAIWEDTTSRKQVKLKLDFTVDLLIVGLEPGKGKNEATFGSVIVETSCGLLRTSVSGFTDKMRQFIFDNFHALKDTVMAVRANSVMWPSASNDKNSLFLPRFVELRKDKLQGDNLWQVLRQYEDAVKAG